MDSVTFMSLSLPERKAFCQDKIEAHSPGQTAHDVLMIKVYRGLLELIDEVLLQAESNLKTE